MKIQNISQTMSFKNLQYTERLKSIVANEKTPSKIIKDFSNARDIVVLTNAHKKRYVDVILDCDDYGQITASISSKKQGTPYHPDSAYRFSDKNKNIKKFAKWINSWNYDYSPKGLENFENLKKLALETMTRHREAKGEVNYLIY